MHTDLPDPVTASPIAVHLYILGQVQAVGYRMSMQAMAGQLQLQGWVRNRRDGRVEALVQGPPDRVARMLAWCQNGPPLARVEQLVQQPQQPDPQWTRFACRDTID